MTALPEKFKERMKVLLGTDYTAFIESYTLPPVRAFRVNTDKISLEEFERINIFGRKKIPYVKNGYYFSYDKIGNHPFHHAGMIYVQEPAAMAPAECIDINPEWCVLDMCAAPGGKSTQLKNKLNENAVLVSNEIIPSRCKILTGNFERLGLKNTVTTCLDTGKLAKIFPKTFDLIMVDAPCSGEGMFRKDDTAIEEWSEENVRKCAIRQEEILENATVCLKDGGYIIYATCTFSLEENEMLVNAFLQEHPEFELIEVKKEVQNATLPGIFFDGCKEKNIRFARRFYPHKAPGEGQFMAVLKSKREPTLQKSAEKAKSTTDRIVADFLGSVLEDYDPSFVQLAGDKAFYFTPDFPIKKGVAFSCGVTIGEVKKNYILPHHQFFMAMGNKFKRKIELAPDSEELKKYLHGEEITCDCDNGWAVVTVNGCSVGGVKVSGGKGKNHYPKGLRRK